MSDNQPNYYAIIPANIRYCKGLSSGAKLLYGEITALTNKEGFCWATNSYFASLYDVDERTISRWIHMLLENIFIRVKTDQASGNTRKIWIVTPHDINVPTPTDNVVTPTYKNVPTPTNKNVLHNNTSINNTREREEKKGSAVASPPPNFFSKGKIKMVQEEYDQIYKDNPDLNIPELFDRAADWLASEGETKKDYAAFMRNWIKKHREFAKSSPQKKNESNQEFALKVKKAHPSRVDVSHDWIEFIHPTHPFYIHFNENGFREQVLGYMRKINLTVGDL